ncbi:hypothetical protein LSH36_3151g00005 [Paralvinella palmiformis]|uniref:Uncharacterized protein n=1 Tax=Paralvinella palmiformis TaxID=53620 RepID=A0AAD9MMY8_9ANNE|nr:hypothetical protein LSH36_3151g00005 [Paralvinella palmiformis]
MAFFKLNLKTTMIRKRNDYFRMGKGQSLIAHTRIRLGFSPLIQQLFTLRLVTSSVCHRCNTNEEESTSHMPLTE